MTTTSYEKTIMYRTQLVKESEMPFGKVQILNPEGVVNLFRPYYEDRPSEEFLVIFLNTANVITGVLRASVGGLAASIVEPREVFRSAALANAAAIICVHNHPSGNANESREDVRITQQLAEAGKLMGIPLHDHIIITETGYTSLAEKGYVA